MVTTHKYKKLSHIYMHIYLFMINQEKIRKMAELWSTYEHLEALS